MTETGIKGRVALITGCGSEGGIGFAIAQAFVDAGAKVAITATSDRIHTRAAELGGVFAATADLTKPTEVTGLFTAVRAAFGPVDILVNNAGMVQTGLRIKRARIEGLTDEAWASHLALNVTTAFHCIRAVLPAMQAGGYGRIVNIASVTGPLVGIEGSAGYSAGKAAMTGLTRATALENARFGITCNAVLPGWIATPSSSPREIKAGKASPAARPGMPDEVAACALFLASAGAAYVNGTMLVVDGGNSLIEMKGGGGY
jgi:3-oxoacyl-[acyl-carrier protein] reductase